MGEGQRQYALKLLMFDMSGMYSMMTYGDYVVSTPALDEMPPTLTENALIDRADITAKLHLAFSEPIKKLRVHYRIVGDTPWSEQVLIPMSLAFDVNLAGLTSGQFYEYQYVFEDNVGNQTLTEWGKI